jgi:hypothetical protein
MRQQNEYSGTSTYTDTIGVCEVALGISQACLGCYLVLQVYTGVYRYNNQLCLCKRRGMLISCQSVKKGQNQVDGRTSLGPL